jgi:hypothetical protein
VLVATLESTPPSVTHWTRASMAKRSGLSKSTVGRIWRMFELGPHRTDTFKLSTDPLFVEKVYDVVGLYLNPPEAAVVYCVDETSQVQALARSQPAFPMMPGCPRTDPRLPAPPGHDARRVFVSRHGVAAAVSLAALQPTIRTIAGPRQVARESRFERPSPPLPATERRAAKIPASQHPRERGMDAAASAEAV